MLHLKVFLYLINKIDIMKKIIIVVIMFLVSFLGLHSQNVELKKYFKHKLTFPISNYFSLQTDYSFSDTLINSIIKASFLNQHISMTPYYFGSYSTAPNYTLKGKERVLLEKFPIDRVLSVGYFPTHTDITYYLLLEETVFYIKYDLWGFSKSSGVPKIQICLFYANKNGYIIEEPEKELEVLVESKINRDSTIDWHSNEYGFHTYLTYKIGSDGLLEIISSYTEGDYNGPGDFEPDFENDNVYFVEYINDSVKIRGEFVYKDNNEDSKQVCQSRFIYKIDKEGNDHLFLCGEDFVVIDDDDGYVNVRKNPDSRSKILYTLPSGKLIGIKKIEHSQWVKVIKHPSDFFYENSGYIHASRIREVDWVEYIDDYIRLNE